MRYLRRAIAVLVSLALAAGAAAWQHRQQTGSAALASEAGFRWFRGNLHTHTLWSDGDDYPEMVAAWYRDKGYHFLAFTDHNTLHSGERWIDVEKSKGGAKAYEKLLARFPAGWIDERLQEGRKQVRLKRLSEIEPKFNAAGEYLLIQGEEVSDKFGKLPVHLNAMNVQEAIPPLGGESVTEVIQRTADAVAAQSRRTGQPMMLHLNHPNFHYAVTPEDLMRVRGENYFEVYNGHPGVANSGNATHLSTERMWDVMLAYRVADLGLPLMYGLATDDGHSYHSIPSRTSEPGRGWIMVLAAELTPAALIGAIEQGRFYASSGVTLKRVVSTASGLDVEVEPAPESTYVIEFVGTLKDFNRGSEPAAEEKPLGKKYSADIGRVLQTVAGTQARYEFRGNELYVRARVISSRQHPNPSELGEFERAWVQPVRGPAAPAAAQ